MCSAMTGRAKWTHSCLDLIEVVISNTNSDVLNATERVLGIGPSGRPKKTFEGGSRSTPLKEMGARLLCAYQLMFGIRS